MCWIYLVCTSHKGFPKHLTEIIIVVLTNPQDLIDWRSFFYNEGGKTLEEVELIEDVPAY